MTDWRLSIFGLITLLVVYYLQDGIVGFVRKALSLAARADADRRPPTLSRRSGRRGASQCVAAGATGDACSMLRGMLMQFGGLKALNDVDLTVRRGTIHGLIGPNGSGKSTMMNVLTGIYVPTAGTIEFDGQSIVGRTSADIALSGIARTFQNVQLFGEMTALQNVLVGLHHTLPQQPARRGAAHAALPARGARGARRARSACCSFVGLADARRPKRRATCLTASSACWRSRARWRSTRSCCCSTSRRPASPRRTSRS